MARIGIIGTGWGARVQVPAFREAGLDVVAIAGNDAAKTERLARELGSIRAFPDWRDLIRERSLDLISIVTPPSEHLPMVRVAFDEGKHVLCEKPTAMNADEAEQMVAMARRHPDQIALIDHELRFLPAWRKARERVRSIAPIRYVEIRYSSPSRGDRNRPWNWWSDHTRGGGVLGAIGSHFIDALRYFAGEISEIQALLHTFVESRPLDGVERPVTTDDFASLTARLVNGGMASMLLSVVAGVDEPTSFTIHGENGVIRLVGEELLLAKAAGELVTDEGGMMARRPGNSDGGAFGSGTVYLGRALRSAIDDGKREVLAPAATFEDGLAQQRVLDAARHSAANRGQWESVRTQS